MSSKFNVKTNDKVGRYCTAACDLSAGEIIFYDEPFSIGPKYGSFIICLGCHRPLNEITLCDNCSWPVCNSECANEIVHKDNECQMFSSAKIKFNVDDHNPSTQLECIAVLRTLLESERNPTRWSSEVSIMEAHTNERKANIEFWAAEQNNIVDFLYDRCRLSKRFDKETIAYVCGILEVNCFEIILDGYNSIRGLYPKLGVMSHNCVANTTHSLIPNSDHMMAVRTTVPVKQGEELYSSYTRSTDPALMRRMKLWENKYFLCECKRCSDPTELGTHLNTLKCTKCDNGLVITTNPLDNDAHWKCTQCDYTINGVGVQKVYQVVQNELEEFENMAIGPEKIEQGEKLLKKYKSFLHPRHAFNMSLWHELSQQYGRAEGYSLDMLPDIMLERKAEMCKNLIQTYEVIEPGLTRLRGLALYELHVALLLLNRSRFEYKSITIDKFEEEMNKVADLLRECGNILSLEPEGSQEAEIAASAFHAEIQLRKSLENIKEKLLKENQAEENQIEQ